MNSHEYLTELEISYNQVTNSMLGKISSAFIKVPSLSRLSLKGNLIGGPSKSSNKSLDYFLQRVNQDLDLRSLDLSDNLICNENVIILVKNVLAADPDKCKLKELQLNDSKLTDYGHRTLLKAHSLSKLRGVLDLQHNPLPLQENLIRTAARDEKYEMKITRRGIKRELKPMPWRTSACSR